MAAEEKPNCPNRELLPEVNLYPHFWHLIINDDKQSTFNSLVVKKKLLIGKANFFVKLFDNRCLEQNFLVFSFLKKTKKMIFLGLNHFPSKTGVNGRAPWPSY